MKSQQRLVGEGFKTDQFQRLQVHGSMLGRLVGKGDRDKAKVQPLEGVLASTSTYWGDLFVAVIFDLVVLVVLSFLPLVLNSLLSPLPSQHTALIPRSTTQDKKRR